MEIAFHNKSAAEIVISIEPLCDDYTLAIDGKAVLSVASSEKPIGIVVGDGVISVWVDDVDGYEVRRT